MAIKEAKTIAEYAIRKWLIEQNFATEYFDLIVTGNVGTLTDRDQNSMALVYDPGTKSVYIEE